jgi:hypothetical protein
MMNRLNVQACRDNSIACISNRTDIMTQDWTSFLTSQGFAADGSSSGSLVGELAAARDGTVLAPVADQGLIRATGVDAAEFLHNLMTNDIKGITARNARFAGLCTAKGRLLALFLIWRDGDDFLLMLPRGILPAILKKLSMYVLRAKVKRPFPEICRDSAWRRYPADTSSASMKRAGCWRCVPRRRQSAGRNWPHPPNLWHFRCGTGWKSLPASRASSPPRKKRLCRKC